MDTNNTDSVERYSIRLIIVFFSPAFLAARAIVTGKFDLDFCLAHRMLVLTRTQRIYGQSALTGIPCARS
jgi:hypothetical protein